MSSRRERIKIGETPLRYDFDTARDAVSSFNRNAGLISTPALFMEAPDIVNGPLKNGNMHAVVAFLTCGYRYLPGYEQLSEREVGKLLTEYLKPVDRGGSGGGLRDFQIPVGRALVEAGIIIEDVPTKDEDGEEARPTPRRVNLPEARSGD